MNKNTILIWAVILLVILNITTIATIVIHSYTEKTVEQVLTLDNDGQNVLNGQYMKQKVGFNEKQMELFRNFKHEFQPTANQIIIDIDVLKNEMFNELNKEQTDTVKLSILSDKIGVLHADLKKRTFIFYLKIKSICQPDQQNLLKETFSPLYRNKSDSCAPGMRNGRNNGRGNGFRNQQE